MIAQVLTVGFAGALGALCRWLLSKGVNAAFPASIPWGTAVVNVIGCFFFGLVWSLIHEKMAIPPKWELAMLTGFMGAFTTFSTFMFESHHLIQSGRYLALLAHTGGQLLLGLVALVFGMYVAEVC